MQLEARWAAGADDLDVFPEHALRLTGSQRLHRGLFDREPSGEVRSRVAALGTIRNLTGREHAVQEPSAVLVEQLRDAGDVGGVDADAEDVHDRSTA
jgi:hypothetical protein